MSAFGPAPAPPLDWEEFLEKAKHVWEQATPSREFIEALHEEWEHIAHKEAPALFQRKEQAGGVLQSKEQVLQQALAARNTLRPTPSWAAAVLTRTLGTASGVCNESVWEQLEHTITSKKRENGSACT